MTVPPETWLELLAWTKASFEALSIGSTAYELYNKYIKDPETQREAQRVSAVFSTFSQAEVDSLIKRMKNCQTQFATEGNADQRITCICSVLNTAKEANGGELPEIDDWFRIYSQLKCNNHLP